MPPSIDPRWLHGLSVYQDVVLAGRTVIRGVRDCQGRWEAIAPHLPSSGSVLDVGSNFGWFGLQICTTLPGYTVASVEGDLRSARVQRAVLESAGCERVCLLVGRANTGLMRRFAQAGQRFDAALCLSVMHWIPDHREFLAALGAITARLLIEHPDPREAGSGVDRIRQEIGHVGPYLQGLFADRPVRCLREFPSHRQSPYPRQLWLVGEPSGGNREASAGLDAAALLAMSPAWPPRSWWLAGFDRCALQAAEARNRPCRILLGPAGLAWQEGRPGDPTLAQLRRRTGRVPHRGLFTPGRWCYRHARRLAGAILRRLGLRGA
jgi:SAM-dependent methyltransferase